MADTFTAVDLSKLPAPTVVGPLDFETIYGEVLADFLEEVPDFDATVECLSRPVGLSRCPSCQRHQPGA